MKRILLAEDEEILRMLIVDTFEEMNYVVDEAEDGQEALDYIEKHTYDLIIIDYMMPYLTGLEVIQIAKPMIEQSKTKILMLSAKSQEYEQNRVLGAGADFYMTKPFIPSQLLQMVEGIFNGK
ncbi:DNA-binding response OmpR family regulator [Bacillus sp. SORGH_AS 510]|uniref:response regulator n=1 Tax=Bacillus sp. SORGH_AS_0510 TaxID=3041771 RepID=UPI0027826A83|nr:response regulator [Bacillus sp. SORGH_AS_0510]MDQ1147274.1 DNA-binding response OmpR family regulator [Bacillus sp. SORGH_AS_0510]